MNILLITDLYPVNNSKDPRTLSAFVENWNKLGYKTDILRPNFLFNAFIRGKKIFENAIFEDEKTKSKIFNVNYSTPFLTDVTRKLPEEFSIDNYDVVVSHMPSGSLFAKKLLENKEIPYINAVHASDIEVLTNLLYKIHFSKNLKETYLKADLIAARSPELEKKIIKLMPYIKCKTFVAYSGIESKYIEPKSFFLKKYEDFSEIRNGFLHIITVASLIKRKNIDIIIKSLAKLPHRNWHYKIIGEGPELKRLKELVIKLKIYENVTFLGNLPREQVLEELKTSDIFILLSKKETFGMAYLEAMAKANIVISSFNDGIDGILQNNVNGFATKQRVNLLVNTINKIQSMPEDALKKIYENAYNTITEYTAEKAAINYIVNIKSLLK